MRILKFIALAVALIAAACVNAQSLEKKKITLAVGGKTLLYYLPLTIAERKGYFKSEGLDVEIVDFPGGAKALQAMVGGSADVVSGAYEHTINMHAKGVPIVAIALQGRYNGIVLGISKAKAAQYKSAADLKGLKVGVTAPGSSTHMSVQNLAVKAGLKPDDFSAIGVGASAGAVAAMKRGGIDAISNLDPVITKLEDRRRHRDRVRYAHGERHEGGLRRRLSRRLHLRARRVGEEESQHGAGDRQRDGPRGAVAAHRERR